MKKYLNPSYVLAFDKPTLPFLYSFLLVLLVSVFKNFMKLSFFEGDTLYKIFSFAKEVEFLNFLPSMFFLKLSMLLNLIFPVFMLSFLFLYAALIQTMIYFFYPLPKRFTYILNIVFVYSSTFYVLTILPIIGTLLWPLFFYIFLVKSISKLYEFSKLKSLLIVCLPFLIFIFLVLIFALSIFGSFF